MIYDTTFVRLPTYLHIIKGDKRLYNISFLRGMKIFFCSQKYYWAANLLANYFSTLLHLIEIRRYLIEY